MHDAIASDPPASLETFSLTDRELVSSGVLSWSSDPRSGITMLELRFDEFTNDQICRNGDQFSYHECGDNPYSEA